MRPQTADAALKRANTESAANTNRPHTAPPVTDISHCDDVLDTLGTLHMDAGDPAMVLAEASALAYQLQNCWPEQQKADMDAYWCELECEYGFKLPKDSWDASAPPRPISGDPLLEDHEVGQVDVEVGELNAAEEAISAAAKELESIRVRRRGLEAVLETETFVSPKAGNPESAADIADSRLMSLRQEVEELQAHTVICTENASSSTAVISQHFACKQIPEGACLLPKFVPLAVWVDDVQRVCDSGFDGDMQCGSTTNEAGDSMVNPVSIKDLTSAIGTQLDDLLGELDEFDRIHDSVCHLTAM